MTVRSLTAADADTYREIRLRSLKQDPFAFSSKFEDEAAFGTAVWQQRLTSFNGRPNAVFLDEIDMGGSIQAVGTAGIGYGEDRPEPMLFGMWVDPAARQRGVGARLTKACLHWATDEGAVAVLLWVVRSNNPAIRMYEACGFVATDEVQALPSDPCTDEMVMRCPL